MIQPANRLEGISEYYFAGKLREIARMKSEGRPVINLGIGSPDLPPAPVVGARLSLAMEDPAAHGYQSYTGIPAYRQAWAGWYKRHYRTELNPDHEILPLMGSKEGIMHLAMSFLGPGDVALVPNPGYPTYKAASILAGAEVRTYDLKASGNWLPDIRQLETTDLKRVKLMWVNYPHMPTGAPATAALFQNLVDFGLRHNILIVNDNPYSFILNEQPISILAASGARETAVELNSLSKSHNMAGWRIGMLAGHAEHLKTVLRFKSNMDSGQFLPAQHAAIEALQLPETWYAELNATYRHRQLAALDLLDAIGCTCAPGQQGLFVWARIPKAYPAGFALSDHLLYEHNLFLTPGGIFGSAGDDYIRVSLCTPVEIFREAQNRLEQPKSIRA
jgi:aspartate/methionine/tyrosine aminotransferase